MAEKNKNIKPELNFTGSYKKKECSWFFGIRRLSYLNSMSDLANKKYQIFVHTVTFNIIVFNQQE